MPYPNFHAARVRDPDDFARIVVLKTLDDGIMIYGGPLKSDPKGNAVTQAYRFPKDKFTVAQAKKWLKDHDIKYILFEEASGKSTSGFQIKSNFELKDIDEGKGIVTGLCSIFNNVDSDGDMVITGAFTKTIEERGPKSAKPRIKHLWQHDSWSPIGFPQVLEEIEEGLYFESVFGKDTFSQDKLQQHIDGIITELSFGYNTIRSEDVNDEDGELLYHKLLELKLWEYSSVTWGANSLTRIISAKGEIEDMVENLNKRLETLSKGLKNGKYTDDTCEQFEVEIMKIKAIIKSLNIEPAPEDNSTQTIIAPTMQQILQTILKTFNDG